MSFWEYAERWKQEGLAIVLVTHLLTDKALVDRVLELAIPGARGGDRW